MPANDTVYSIWFILILVAPLWTNAFVYMVVGRMVWTFLPNHKLGGIKAWRFGMGFVILDILYVFPLFSGNERPANKLSAFLVQAFGASKASGNNISIATIMQGLHIYMIGVGVQQFFIILFSVLLVRLHMRLRNEAPSSEVVKALRLLYVVYAALLMITIRIIFRLIEYSSGINSSIPNHEAFMFIFESIPMLVAIVLFNFVHPGAVMAGKESDIPGRKARKTMFPKGGKKGDGYEGVGYENMGRDSPSYEEVPYNGVAHENTSYGNGPDAQSQAELGFLAPQGPRY